MRWRPSSRAIPVGVGLLAALVSASAPVAAAQARPSSFGRRVTVTVVDSSGAPLSGASVVMPAIGRGASTGADGTALLAEVPLQGLSVHARHDGFEPRVTRLDAGGEDVMIAVELVPAAQPVPAIVAAALERPSGFDARRRSGRFPSRAFLTRDALARRPDLAVVTALRGPWRRERLLALGHAESLRREAGPSDPEDCRPAVLVDGAEPYGWNPLALPRAQAFAVEAHAPLDGPIPDVYEGIGGACGVVAVWTHPPLEDVGEAGPSAPRVRLRGRVVDRADRPVAGVRLVVGDAPDTSVADGEGRFVLDVAEGPHVLHVLRLGLRPSTFPIAVAPADSAEEQVLRLAADATVRTLATVRVEGRGGPRPVPATSNLAGFQARRASGIYPRTAPGAGARRGGVHAVLRAVRVPRRRSVRPAGVH